MWKQTFYIQFKEKTTNTKTVFMILIFAVAISFNEINVDSVKSTWRLVFGRVFRFALHPLTSCRSQSKLCLGFHLTNRQSRNHSQRREENTLLLPPSAANVSPQLIAPLCQITASLSCRSQTNKPKQDSSEHTEAENNIVECVEIECHFFANHSNFLFNLAFFLQGVLYS